MMSIDLLDAKILRALFRDGRKPFVEIADKLGVSKDIIWRHYNRMMKAGVIVGSTAQINHQRLGYAGVATLQLNVESNGINEVLAEAANNFEIYVFRQYNGRFNAGSIVRFKKLRDLDRLKEVICRHKMVNEVKTYVWTDVRNIPENIIPQVFPLQENDRLETSWLSDAPASFIDELDKRIIDFLSTDGRASFRKIGLEIGVSADTVGRRYEILKKSNTMGVTVQVDPSKLGYQAVLDVSIALSNQSETANIVNKLARIPGVSYILRIAGDYDLQVVALVGDCKSIMKINDKIEEISHIKRIEGLIRNFQSPGHEVWPGRLQHISTF